MSVFHYAALGGHLEMIKYLLAIDKFLLDDKSLFGISYSSFFLLYTNSFGMYKWIFRMRGHTT